jgi:ABC-type multidrug transport system ATPase subunit
MQDLFTNINHAAEFLAAMNIKRSLFDTTLGLSGGEEARVALAIALCDLVNNGRDMLILDEADDGLDTATRRSVIQFITQKCKELNVTLFVISHSSNEIEDQFDQIILVDNQTIRLASKN